MRTKTVYPTKEVMHIWANQNAEHARNSSNDVYFHGDVIYSYGSHFPMARHFNGVVLITTQGYSNTTRKHMSQLRRAIWKEEVPCCYIPLGEMHECMETHVKNFDYWANDVEDALKKLKRARKPEIYVDTISGIRQEAQRYSEVTGIAIPEEYRLRIWADNIEQYNDAVVSEREIVEQRKQQEKERALPLYDANREAWHNDMDSEWKQTLSTEERSLLRRASALFNETWLRIKGEELQTSLGIRIPIAVAERCYRQYLTKLAAGGCSSEKECNGKMAGYDVRTVTKDVLIVGCHNIPRYEIDYIANKLNWNK